MFKRVPSSVWLSPQPYLSVAATLLMVTFPSTLSDQFLSTVEKLLPQQAFLPLVEAPAPANPPVTERLEISDPFDSPHPLPWNWVLETHAEVSADGGTGVRYYRTPSLVSPDGEYAAYSRIELQVEPELYRSRVSTVLFVENLKTGELKTINASKGKLSLYTSQEADKPGAISMAVPVSWSENGDRVLARKLEGWFNTSDASDLAVIWERDNNRTTVIAPSGNDYDVAVLLGWSQSNPSQVLFRAGELGDEDLPVWAVDLQGKTVATANDQPIVFGQAISHLWAGSQRYW